MVAGLHQRPLGRAMSRAEIMYIAAVAAFYHCIVFWHQGSHGAQPVLMPLSEKMRTEVADAA